MGVDGARSALGFEPGLHTTRPQRTRSSLSFKARGLSTAERFERKPLIRRLSGTHLVVNESRAQVGVPAGPGTGRAVVRHALQELALLRRRLGHDIEVNRAQLIGVQLLVRQHVLDAVAHEGDVP